MQFNQVVGKAINNVANKNFQILAFYFYSPYLLPPLVTGRHCQLLMALTGISIITFT